MAQTKIMYQNYVTRKVEPEDAFKGGYPEWPWLDRIADMWIVRFAFAGAYIAFYVAFAPSYWWFLLLPIEFLMGPVQGAVVNWCGHKYGYSNFDNDDHSKNTLPWDLLLLGELFQNNHHKSANSPNFAKKWFEIDPTYPVVMALHYMGVIKLRKVPVKQELKKAA